MTDIVLTPITSGYNLAKINANFVKVQNVINNEVLHLTGGNNVMAQNLDMNFHGLLNLRTDLNDPNSMLTLAQADARFYNVTGDTLQGTMDAAANQIINLPVPTDPTSPARKLETDAAKAQSVRAPDGESLLPLVAAVSRANKVMGFDAQGNPLASLPLSGSGTELAIDLANNTDQNKGVGYIGFLAEGTGAQPNTLRNAMAEAVSVMSFIPTSLKAAIKDGTSTVDLTTYVQAAVDWAASRKVAIVFRGGSFTFRRVNLPTGSTVLSDRATIYAVSGTFVSGGLAATGIFEATNATDIFISGLVVKQRLANDQCFGILLDTCQRVTVQDNYFETSGGRSVCMRLCTDCDVLRNRIRLGQVAYGCGVEMIHECKYIRVRGNVITGYRVTQATAGGGVQPSGDLWGSVGVSCRITDSFLTTYNGWNYLTGTYTVPVSGAVTPVVIPVVGIAADGRWECAAACSLSQTTGIQDTNKVPVTIGAGQISIANVPTGAPGTVITWTALAYTNSPRYIEVSDNTIIGMIYAGISLITARDVIATNNRMMSIGDIAWDPEGTMRCHLIGGSIEDSGNDGAVLAGFGSSVTGCVFLRNGNRGIRVVQPNNAYNYAVVGDVVFPYGLRGGYNINGNTIQSTFVGIVVPDKSMGVDITGNKVSLQIRGIEVGTGCSISITGNEVVGHILATGTQELVIANNVVRDSWQENISLISCNKFSVANNTVMRTSGNFAGGNGTRWATCTNGNIRNNTYISIIAGAGKVAELDVGGSTGVTNTGAAIL